MTRQLACAALLALGALAPARAGAQDIQGADPAPGAVAQPVLAERPRSLSDVAAPAPRTGLEAAWPGGHALPAAPQQDSVAPWPWGWMARGLAGGLVAGPIGAAVAYNMVGRGEAGAALDERVRARRKEAVVVGGMLGTAVLAVVLLRLVDLDGTSQGNGGGPGPEPA